MCSEATIEKVRDLLKAPLLPTDGIRAQAADLADHAVSVDALLSPTDNTEFLQQAYLEILGRSPGEECLANWLGHLGRNKMSRVAILKQLADSEEGRLRNVRVHGLDYALAESQQSNNDCQAAGQARWSVRNPLKGVPATGLALSSAINTDSKIAAAERRISRLAEESAEVIGHIEHRLSRLQVQSSSMPEIQLVASEQPGNATEPPELTEKVEQLSERMLQLSKALPESQLDEHLKSIRLEADGDAAGANLLTNWLASGSGLYSLICSCQRRGIELSAIATCAGDVGLVRSLGVNALPLTTCELLQSCSPSTAGGVFLRSQLAEAENDELIRLLLAAEHAMVPGGHLLIEEPRELSEMNQRRLQAALEICGFDHMPNINDGFVAGLSDAQGRSSLLVAKKPIAHEVHA